MAGSSHAHQKLQHCAAEFVDPLGGYVRPRSYFVIVEADKLGARETVHRVLHRFRDWPLVPGHHKKLRSEVLDRPRVE